jgi:hypothetical protein
MVGLNMQVTLALLQVNTATQNCKCYLHKKTNVSNKFFNSTALD